MLVAARSRSISITWKPSFSTRAGKSRVASPAPGTHFAISHGVGPSPVVAVINTNPDLVELFKVRIEAAGFVVLLIHVAEIRAGLDIGSVVEQHDPTVIVYDVVPPYERNWRFLQHLRGTVLQNRRFVLTTPNERALQCVVGRDESVYEIIEGEGEMDAVVQAVREAARSRPTK